MFRFKGRLLSLASVLMLLFVVSCLRLTWAQYEPAPRSYFLKHQTEVTELYFSEDSSTTLKGDWLFYPKQFITEPNSVFVPQKIQLPTPFKVLTGSNIAYGTFIAHFKIPKQFIGRRIGILIPNQYGAYRVHLNGDFLVRLGEISKTAQGQITEKAPRIAYFVAQSEYFTLSIQASNYTHLHGGFEKPMKIGLASTVNRQFQLQMMSIAMVCGAVLGVGLFTILFSIFRGSSERNSRSVFIFGLFIIFLALHNLFSAPYAYSIFTQIDWLWGTRLEYLFTFLAILFFLSYMHLFNPRYLKHSIYYVGALLLILNVLITLLTGPEVFERFALYSAIYGLIVLGNFIYGFYQTIKLKQPISYANLGAVILLCLTFLNDYLLLINAIQSIHLSFASTSLYALLIMFQQSKHYAYQTYHTEQLNQELMSLNNSLDQKVKERTAQLHDLNKKLEIQINTDALTGAFNRRALNAEIQKRFQITVQDPQHSLIFAMIDVDYFKNYNDHYGHLKGDEILCNLVSIMKQVLPPSAFLARYGGEEFVILLHDTSIHIAENLLENILKAIREAGLEHTNRLDQKDYITVSIGAAYMNQTYCYMDIYELMKAADVNLYQAKSEGRDQLVIPKS